jgi:hypothetical protein
VLANIRVVWERPTREKHSSFAEIFLNYDCKKYFNISPGGTFYQKMI